MATYKWYEDNIPAIQAKQMEDFCTYKSIPFERIEKFDTGIVHVKMMLSVEEAELANMYLERILRHG